MNKNNKKLDKLLNIKNLLSIYFERKYFEKELKEYFILLISVDGNRRSYNVSINAYEYIKRKLKENNFFLVYTSWFFQPDRLVQKIKNNENIQINYNDDLDKIYIFDKSLICQFSFKKGIAELEEIFKYDRTCFITIYEFLLNQDEFFFEKSKFYKILKNYFKYFTDEEKLLVEVMQ